MHGTLVVIHTTIESYCFQKVHNLHGKTHIAGSFGNLWKRILGKVP